MKDNFFTIVKDDGTEVQCEILFTFDNQETGKSYVVYTDNTCDDEGNVMVFASVYDPTGENLSLMPVETEAEWAVIEDMMESLQESLLDEDDTVEE